MLGNGAKIDECFDEHGILTDEGIVLLAEESERGELGDGKGCVHLRTRSLKMFERDDRLKVVDEVFLRIDLIVETDE